MRYKVGGQALLSLPPTPRKGEKTTSLKGGTANEDVLPQMLEYAKEEVAKLINRAKLKQKQPERNKTYEYLTLFIERFEELETTLEALKTEKRIALPKDAEKIYDEVEKIKGDELANALGEAIALFREKSAGRIQVGAYSNHRNGYQKATSL